MKICKLVDEFEADRPEVGYLFYDEPSRDFFIELSENKRAGDASLLFQLFIEKGEYAIGREWSARWVRQRIVPTDRQNLGAILRENHLTEYNEYKLLMISGGRCAQDDCAVLPAVEQNLPEWLRQRLRGKTAWAAALDGFVLLTCFRDDTIRRIDLEPFLQTEKNFQILLTRPGQFPSLKVLPGGNGITWGEGMDITAEQLHKMGTQIPLTGSEWKSNVRQQVIDTGEACSILACSRQYVDQLVRKGILVPIKSGAHSRLFIRSEVETLS